MKPALALAVVLVLASVGPSHGAAARQCSAPSVRTVAATRDARVFHLEGGTFACLYRGTRIYALGDEPAEPDYSRAENIRLAGRYVAYELVWIGRLETSFDVKVRDLRTGRWVHRVRANAAPLADEVSTNAPGVSDLELARTGAVAWITRDPYVDPSMLEVHKADANGHAQLAAGADIDPRSLALSGNRIYWLQGGQPKTATLSAP